MKYAVLLVAAVAVTFSSGGCPLTPPGTTTVLLKNNTNDFTLHVELAYDADQNVSDSGIADAGTKRTFEIAAKGARQFTVACSQIQAIKITRATLDVSAFPDPEIDSRVFRSVDDFSCNQTLTFSFDASAIPIDFHVDFDAR